MRLFSAGTKVGRGFALATVVVGCALVGGVSAQEDRRWDPPEVTIFRDAGFRGPSTTFNEARPNLGLTWPVNSVRVRSGQWELCEATNFRGTCRTYNADTPMLNTMLIGVTVRSLRPVSGGAGGSGDGGPSLRGMASQFFTQPAQNRQRVRACATGNATANCAARTADSFCRNMGWNGSAWQTMETVNRVVFLADVLCTRTGF